MIATDLSESGIPIQTKEMEKMESFKPSLHQTDLKKVWLLYTKGGLMLLVGLLASSLLIAMHFELKTFLLLAVAIWSFCRAYYFAFYVVQHYIDPSYRYSGLIDFAKYSIKRRFR